MAEEPVDWSHTAGYVKVLSASGLFWDKRWCRVDENVVRFYTSKSEERLLFAIPLDASYEAAVAPPLSDKRTFLLEISNKNGDVQRTTRDAIVGGIAGAFVAVGGVFSTVGNVLTSPLRRNPSYDEDEDEDEVEEGEEDEGVYPKGQYSTLLLNFKDAATLEFWMIVAIQAINGAMRASEHFDGDVSANYHCGSTDESEDADALDTHERGFFRKTVDATGDVLSTVGGGVVGGVTGVVNGVGGVVGGVGGAVVGTVGFVGGVLNGSTASDDSLCYLRYFTKKCNNVGAILPETEGDGKFLKVCVYQNQRYLPIRGFSRANLIFSGDPPGLSDWSGANTFPYKVLDRTPPPDGYRWCDVTSGWSTTLSPAYLHDIRKQVATTGSSSGITSKETEANSKVPTEYASSAEMMTIRADSSTPARGSRLSHVNTDEEVEHHSETGKSSLDISMTSPLAHSSSLLNADSSETERLSPVTVDSLPSGQDSSIAVFKERFSVIDIGQTTSYMPSGWIFAKSWDELEEQIETGSFQLADSANLNVRRRRFERQCVRC